MSLRIRRGTEAQRTGVTFDTGELVYTTDSKQLWIGDGITSGGTPVVGSNITGYGLTFNASSKKIEVAGLTADDVAGGVNNKYFSTELAQDAVAPMFTSGSASHSNISFQYDDTLGVINATVTLDGIGLIDIVSDTSPQLGGDLDLNSSDITGTGNIDITGNITVSNLLDAFTVQASSLTSDTFGNDVITFTNNGAVTFANDLFTFGANSNALALTFISELASNAIFTLNSLTDGTTATGSAIEHRTTRGSLDVPLAVQPADALSLSSAWGYDGTGYTQSSIIGMFTDPNGVIDTESVPGMIALINFVDTNPANYRAVFINRKGWLTVGRAITDDAKAHVDINGVMLLAKQSAAPAEPFEGMIAVADRVTWDPAAKGTGGSYPAYYDGSVWTALI